MLALARGEGQSIIIDGRIEVKIVKWSRSAVRVAIQAPREVRIDRDEVWRKMHPGKLTPLEQAEADRGFGGGSGGGPPPGPQDGGNPDAGPPDGTSPGTTDGGDPGEPPKGPG